MGELLEKKVINYKLQITQNRSNYLQITLR